MDKVKLEDNLISCSYIELCDLLRCNFIPYQGLSRYIFN
jgi:ribosome-associated protein YbcJ (S4-like RNA binding protein)